MTPAIRRQHEAQSKIIKALAHPSRLFILGELAKGERTVCELAEMVGVEMPTVSRHLGLLRDAGILKSEKRGAQVFYLIRARCVLKVFECVKAIQLEGGLD